MGGSADVEDIANRLKPSSSWVLQDEKITPRQLGCWGGVSCPSVSRVWQSDTPLSPTEFLNLAETVSGDTTTIHTTDMCGNTLQGCSTELRIKLDGHKYWVKIRTRAPIANTADTDPTSYDGPYTLTIRVQLDD